MDPPTHCPSETYATFTTHLLLCLTFVSNISTWSFISDTLFLTSRQHLRELWEKHFLIGLVFSTRSSYSLSPSCIVICFDQELILHFFLSTECDLFRSFSNQRFLGNFSSEQYLNIIGSPEFQRQHIDWQLFPWFVDILCSRQNSRKFNLEYLFSEKKSSTNLRGHIFRFFCMLKKHILKGLDIFKVLTLLSQHGFNILLSLEISHKCLNFI